MGDLDRVVSRRERLRARLEGTTERGPARGAVRQATSAQLSAIDDGLDLVGVAMARDIAARRAKQTGRRKAWTQALHNAQSAMEEDQDRSPEWVLKRFTPLLARLKATVPHSPSRTGPPGQLTPAPDRERGITKSDDPGRIQPTREVEVGTLLSVAQNVFDNPTRSTPDEADLVRRLLHQAASES